VKLLLLGKDGQVGWELQRALAPLGEVIAWGRADLDLADPAQVRRRAAEVAADVIVNAAAYTAVDRAETEPAFAEAINRDAPAALAEAARECGAWLIHYSTDYVFDGSGSRPWREDDPTEPLSVYGRTKRDGEDAVRASGCRHLLLRTSWVYGSRGGNFAKTMLRLAAERDALRVVADQIGAPTGADLIADVTAHLIRARTPERSGTYHLAAAGETSWHGYARHVITAARAAGRPLRVADEAIEAIPTRDYPLPAQRPLNSRLETRKLRDTFDLTLPDWRRGVDRLVAEIIGG
jgi:dTDP-4-dehydrorhamnose reductase